MADKKNIVLAMMTSSLFLFSNGVQGDEVVAEAMHEEALSYSDLESGDGMHSDLVSQTQSKQNAQSNKNTAGSCSRPGTTGVTGTTGMTGMTGATGMTGMTGMTGTNSPNERSTSNNSAKQPAQK